MPPKRKLDNKKQKAGGKKAKTTTEPPSILDSIKPALNKAPSDSRKNFKVDTNCSYSSSGTVVDDYDCMLNQTNINANNNKFYVIQLIKVGICYFTWNRWGRVGETGQNKLSPFGGDFDGAVNDFKKKFSSKTGNKWENRKKFTPKSGLYTLLEMGEDEPQHDATTLAALSKIGPVEYEASSLDSETQLLMDLIFSSDMFNHALNQFKIDTKKMPLGKLSKSQISKGFECLDEIQRVLDGAGGSGSRSQQQLNELSSRFYTLIPHSFGRCKPPTIGTSEEVRQKLDMLLVLLDIEMAQAMQQHQPDDRGASASKKRPPNPLDANYRLLDAGLELLATDSHEFKVIQTYMTVTGGSVGFQSCKKILAAWKVCRNPECKTFKSHDAISHRKLLWHGTNVAVVAAILKTGLRIMPHSGGRVGKGIYFASENMKSAGYVGLGPGNVGIMFLCEVALGKEHGITIDDYSLVAPPAGYNSIVARGRTEPDPSKDIKIKLDNKDVIVPQGKPVSTSYNNSRFSQSEYLIYQESQCRIRYLLKIQF